MAAALAAAILLPFRASGTDTNVALLLVVVVVAVAAIGSRLAGTLAAVRVAACLGFLLHPALLLADAGAGLPSVRACPPVGRHPG